MGSMKERSPEHHRVLFKGLSPDVSPGDGAAIMVLLTATVKIREACQTVAALPDWRFANIRRILLLSLVLKKAHDFKCFTPLPHRPLQVLM